MKNAATYVTHIKHKLSSVKEKAGRYKQDGYYFRCSLKKIVEESDISMSALSMLISNWETVLKQSVNE